MPPASERGAPTAVVSGLGPNGMLSCLTLLDEGWRVIAVEQRPAYARPIHLCLRRSYVEDLLSLAPELQPKLDLISGPLETDASSCSQKTRPEQHDVIARLQGSPSLLVRVDELEALLFDHLRALAGRGERVSLRRGTRVSAVDNGTENISARLDPCDPTASHDESELIEHPDLLVVAEGGKSVTARQLGKRSFKFSPPRYYLSVHISLPIGPVQRRVDVEHEAGGHRSYWATGHPDERKGTWMVLEVDAPDRAQGSNQIDDVVLETGAAQLLAEELGGRPSRIHDLLTPGFGGTFRFEQQMLLEPTAGQNLVFLGDCAGMGHHALSTGLEVGAVDQTELRRLLQACSEGADSRASGLCAYAERLVDTRLQMLAYGMKEYDRELFGQAAPADTLELLCRASAAARSQPGTEPYEHFQSLM